MKFWTKPPNICEFGTENFFCRLCGCMKSEVTPSAIYSSKRISRLPEEVGKSISWWLLLPTGRNIGCIKIGLHEKDSIGGQAICSQSFIFFSQKGQKGQLLIRLSLNCISSSFDSSCSPSFQWFVKLYSNLYFKFINHLLKRFGHKMSFFEGF